jgi:hypothetical protein
MLPKLHTTCWAGHGLASLKASNSQKTTLMLTCQSCHESIRAHRWGKIRAHSQGWYFSKDGRVYCPRHRPKWAPVLSEAQTSEDYPALNNLVRDFERLASKRNWPLIASQGPGRERIERRGTMRALSTFYRKRSARSPSYHITDRETSLTLRGAGIGAADVPRGQAVAQAGNR